MRRIDLHCYPGTQEWITSQGPYPAALGEYWGKAWVAKTEAEVVADVDAAGVRGGARRVRHRVGHRGAAVRERLRGGAA